MISLTDYLRRSAVSRETIENFLSPRVNCWAKFDPEVGYVLDNYMPRDGLDGCLTISTSQPCGARTPIHYRDRPCRLNTYGNSFTQCHQVSDGETWQEYLAAHLGEPIRNFGMGGFGVYQAYRRMARTEATGLGVPYVLLYIWGDDHCRSLMRCRHAVTYPWWDSARGTMFHGNFWAHVEMDLASGRLEEKPNLLATPASLYKMADPDFMVEALRDDLMLQLCVAEMVDPATLDFKALGALADTLGVPRIDTTSRDALAQSCLQLRNAYGFRATRFIVGKALDFCRKAGKKLMVCALCPTATRQLLQGQPRYDQEMADYLAGAVEPFFDMNRVHAEDYRAFSLPVEEYLKRYYIGHYSPAGNHFFAFAIKNTIVSWLDPRPPTCGDEASRRIGFDGYLPKPPAARAD